MTLWHTGSVMEAYQLFQYDSCPFCFRVRQFLQSAGIDMEIRDTLRDASARAELLSGGGSGTVPCLRIEHAGEVRWLYESQDIIEYLSRDHDA